MTQNASSQLQLKISLLSDGTSWWDGGGAFGLVPRVKWAKLLPPDELNRVPQELRCVLIEVDGADALRPKRLVVDCGVGNKANIGVTAQYDVRQPNGNLIDDLARHCLKPADIDIVIFTHLHGDHAGWATIRPPTLPSRGRGAGEGIVPTFSNARYYVQRQEYEDAMHTNERTRNTYFSENFVPLMEHGVLTLLDGEAQITPSVRVVPTPGHTAGHQSVVVEGGHRPYFILGDLATFMIQFARLPWVTAYDVLPLVTIESKRHWQQWAFKHNAILISPHDTQIPVGKLVETKSGLYSVEPEEL